MRRALSVLFEVIAGFFLYLAFLFAFMEVPTGDAAVKPVIFTVFSIFALAALLVGLTVTRFRKWKRDTGVVLICAAGGTASVIVMFASLALSGDFPKAASPGGMMFIKDYHYVAGGVFVAIVAALGIALVIANRREAKPSEAA